MSSSSACSSDSGGSSPRSSLAGVYTPLAEPVDVARFTPVRPAEYPPDKEATWTLPPELMSFVLMHNALRAEVTKFESLLFKLGSRPLEEWEVDAVKSWWLGHHEHFRHVRSAKDSIVLPFLATRVRVDKSSTPTHEHLDDVVSATRKAFEHKSFAAASDLLPIWHGYRTALYPHLIEEECVYVPLLRAYFPPKEVFATFAEVLKSHYSKLALGSLLHHLPGGREGVMTFLARSGYEWYHWYLEVKGVRAKYRVAMESKIESLLRGEPVASARKSDLKAARSLRPLALNAEYLISNGRHGAGPRDMHKRYSAGRVASRIHSEVSAGKLSLKAALEEAGKKGDEQQPKVKLSIGV